MVVTNSYIKVYRGSVTLHYRKAFDEDPSLALGIESFAIVNLHGVDKILFVAVCGRTNELHTFL